MQFDGADLEQLQQALISAFPAKSQLAQLVRFHLDQNIDAIVGNGNLSDQVFELISWAESHGEINKLIYGAQMRNPGNALLGQYILELDRLESDSRSSAGLSSFQITNLTEAALTQKVDINAVSKLINDINQLEISDFEGRREELENYLKRYQLEFNVPTSSGGMHGNIRALMCGIYGVILTVSQYNVPGWLIFLDSIKGTSENRA